MKCILFITLFISLNSFGGNYYIGAGGNNNNTGTSINQRWLDVTKVNSSTFLPGDSILFAGSQTHVGGLKVPSNGVIISSYGTGQAILSGFVTLTGWVQISPNIYESVPSQTLKPTCNILTVGGVPYAVGRTPNIQYFTYQSANPTTLTSSVLISPYNNMVGAEAVIRKNRYLAEKGTITAQNGTVITYTTNKQIDNNSPSPQNGTANYGFFLQRFAASLDIQNEWWLNTSNGNMRIFSTVNPNTLTVKASYIDTIIYTGTHTNVTIHNIAVEGGGLYGVYMLNGTNVTVQNCTFNNNTRPIYSKNGLNINVSNNTMDNNFEGGIVVANNGKQINILNNTVTNTGQLIGMGLFWASADLNGITAFTDSFPTSNFVNVIGNTVRKIGHMGIDARGSNLTIRRNVIDSFANQVDDAGGFYTWVARLTVNTTNNYVNRILDSNFVSNGIGAYLGTSNTDLRVKGLYIDDQSLNWIIRHNTVWNIPDNCVSMNNPKSVIFQDNTLYNNKVLISLVHKINGAVTGNLISRNILYQKLNTGQENWFHQNDNLSSTGYAPNATGIIESGQDMAFIDTNWISNQLTNGYRVWYSTNGSGITFPPAFALATGSPSWRGSYLHDLISVLPPITVTNTNTTLYTNPTSNLLVINFAGFRKRDPKGVIYDHTATVGRWSSLILIDNGNAPSGGNTPPTVNAGVDKIITLPTNSTSVTATSTLGSGASGAYTWSELSGPNTATNSAPTSATTTWGSLIAGTYQMRVKFLNNLGDSAVDFMQITVNAEPLPPVANAGPDQSVQLPINSTTVSGGGSSDADGTITTWLWTKISGPTGGNITSPSAMITTITNMLAGVYVFRLRVTDNSGLTNDDFIQITILTIVPPVNQPPVSEAGPSQSISLPVNTAALDGSASYDPEGLTITYLWRQISGPSTASITNTTMAQTCVSGLIAGVYIMQLRVTDPSGDTSIDAMSITVAGANQPPTVSAGNDQTITLPTNSVTLTAVASDPESGVITYAWTKLSGPSATIVSPTSASTSVNGLTQGSYIFQVTATDNVGNTATDAVQVTVNPVVPPVNQPPVADAGSNITLTLPTNSTTLIGSGSTDADGTIVAYLWTKISGTGGTLATPTAVNTNLTGLTEGSYTYRLKVTDNNSDTGIAFVQVQVNAAPINLPPTVNAGNDTTITLPSNAVTLTAIATDPEGTTVTYSWTKISGPASGTITIPNGMSTSVTGLTEGSYIFQVTVTDSLGSTGTDAVQVTVNPAPPLLNPVADAGIGQTIILPTNSVTLTGIGTDQDGTITGYAWVKISGGAATIVSPSSATTVVNSLVQGTYEFELTVTDNDGLTGKDTVQIIVNPTPPNIPPVANAGGDQTTSDTTVILNGAGSDQGGTIVSYQWTKISGPINDVIVSPTSAMTQITGLQIGIYVYELTVTDDGAATATDRATITVVSAISQPVIFYRWKTF